MRLLSSDMGGSHPVRECGGLDLYRDVLVTAVRTVVRCQNTERVVGITVFDLDPPTTDMRVLRYSLLRAVSDEDTFFTTVAQQCAHVRVCHWNDLLGESVVGLSGHTHDTQ